MAGFPAWTVRLHVKGAVMAEVHLDLLDRVRIAAPCPMRWEDMEGDDVQRHCDRCDLNVTNLSAMTREQATAWVGEHVGNGRACVGFYKREDGTILTRNCPVGLAALRQRMHGRASRVAAVVGLLLTGGLLFGRGSDRQRSLAEFEPLRSLREWLRPTPPAPPPPLMRSIIAGECSLAPSSADLTKAIAELLNEDMEHEARNSS